MLLSITWLRFIVVGWRPRQYCNIPEWAFRHLVWKEVIQEEGLLSQTAGKQTEFSHKGGRHWNIKRSHPVNSGHSHVWSRAIKKRPCSDHSLHFNIWTVVSVTSIQQPQVSQVQHTVIWSTGADQTSAEDFYLASAVWLECSVTSHNTAPV